MLEDFIVVVIVILERLFLLRLMEEFKSQALEKTMALSTITIICQLTKNCIPCTIV